MAAPGKKELPAITWRNISPPYRDYAYFTNAAAYPFRYRRDGFDRVNAWWLIEAATLVYAEEAFVRTEFGKVGLEQVRFFDGGSTRCVVAGNRDFVIVAFRGTEIRRREGRHDYRNIIGEIVSNLDIKPVSWDMGGRVHRGFRNALDAVWKKEGLGKHVRHLVESGRPVWITGHSLGAALAVLAAHRSKGIRAVYTFGSPRIGDAVFKKSYQVTTCRIVNHRDIVARLPPAGPYHHVGEPRYIDHRGRIHRRPGPFRKNAADTGVPGRPARIPGGLKDHVPVLYAVHLWNRLVT